MLRLNQNRIKRTRLWFFKRTRFDSLEEMLMAITSFKEFYSMGYMNKLTKSAVDGIVSNRDVLKRKLMNTNNDDIEKLYRIRNTIPVHMWTLFSSVLLAVIEEKKIMRIAKIINPKIWRYPNTKKYISLEDPQLIIDIRQIKKWL